MKISELVERLEDIKKRDGDLEVRLLRSPKKGPEADTWFLTTGESNFWCLEMGLEFKGRKVVAI